MQVVTLDECTPGGIAIGECAGGRACSYTTDKSLFVTPYVADTSKHDVEIPFGILKQMLRKQFTLIPVGDKSPPTEDDDKFLGVIEIQDHIRPWETTSHNYFNIDKLQERVEDIAESVQQASGGELKIVHRAVGRRGGLVTIALDKTVHYTITWHKESWFE